MALRASLRAETARVPPSQSPISASARATVSGVGCRRMVAAGLCFAVRPAPARLSRAASSSACTRLIAAPQSFDAANVGVATFSSIIMEAAEQTTALPNGFHVMADLLKDQRPVNIGLHFAEAR